MHFTNVNLGPPNIKATLQMSYEYLRLYTNAYAFQATVTRAVAAKTQGALRTNESPHNGVPSLPDARFIYESVDAAKSLLSIITSYIDAVNCLRYLPLRFSLWVVLPNLTSSLTVTTDTV